MSSGSFSWVDDHDLESIDYQTPNLWFPAFVNGGQASGGTITSGVAGARASFKFTGSAVAVYGIASTVQNSGPPAVQFSLDGQLVHTTIAPNNGSIYFSFPFLVAPSIQNGQHTLEMDVLNATGKYPFALDVIFYKPSNGATPTAAQSIITTSLPVATGQPGNGSSNGKSSAVPVGAIVGGVVGGVAVLIATGVAIWLVCFRGRKRTGRPYLFVSAARPDNLLSDEDVKPTPDAVMGYSGSQSAAVPAPQSTRTSVPPSTDSTPSRYQLPQFGYTPLEPPSNGYGVGSSSIARPSYPYTSSSYLGVNAQRQTTSPNQPERSKAAEAGLLSVPRQAAAFHTNSGNRFDETPGCASVNGLDVNDLVDIPPTYAAN